MTGSAAAFSSVCARAAGVTSTRAISSASGARRRLPRLPLHELEGAVFPEHFGDRRERLFRLRLDRRLAGVEEDPVDRGGALVRQRLRELGGAELDHLLESGFLDDDELVIFAAVGYRDFHPQE